MKINVVIPLYNKEITIKRCIESVLSQSYQPYEIIVVNDGSTDDSLKIAEEVKSKKVRIINQNNCGVSSARNNGIEQSDTDWIALLDADDYWHKSHLEVFVNAFRMFPECSYFSNLKAKNSRQLGLKQHDPLCVNDYPRYALEKGWGVHSSSVMFKKDIICRAGKFEIGENHGEDISAWLRLSFFSPLVLSGYATVVYSRDDKNRLTDRLIINDDAFIKLTDTILKHNGYLYDDKRIIQELRNKVFMSHAYNAICKGNKEITRKFASQASGTRYFYKEYRLLCLLSFLPVNLSKSMLLFRNKIYMALKNI